MISWRSRPSVLKEMKYWLYKPKRIYKFIFVKNLKRWIFDDDKYQYFNKLSHSLKAGGGVKACLGFGLSLYHRFAEFFLLFPMVNHVLNVIFNGSRLIWANVRASLGKSLIFPILIYRGKMAKIQSKMSIKAVKMV